MKPDTTPARLPLKSITLLEGPLKLEAARQHEMQPTPTLVGTNAAFENEVKIV